MSKQKYNIEHKNYAIKVMEWFYFIETDFDPDKHEVGESNYSIVVNTAPFKSMIVDLTRVNDTFWFFEERISGFTKKAKEDYYINKLMFLETGPYKVYITQVDKLNTCNMSVTSHLNKTSYDRCR